MRILETTIAVLVAAYLIYETIRVWRLVHISAGLVHAAKPYQRIEGNAKLLVLGDSTAVGVGAEPGETVAARLARLLDASVENYAVSGAVTADLMQQLAQAKKERYDYVLIQIGANDVIRSRPFGAATRQLGTALARLVPRAGQVIVLTAGRIGDAPLFPILVRPILNAQSLTLRRDFVGASAEYGATYVDLYNAPLGMMAENPKRYYAPDGLHLTGEGYGLWFEYVKEAIRKS